MNAVFVLIFCLIIVLFGLFLLIVLMKASFCLDELKPIDYKKGSYDIGPFDRLLIRARNIEDGQLILINSVINNEADGIFEFKNEKDWLKSAINIAQCSFDCYKYQYCEIVCESENATKTIWVNGKWI